MVVVYAGSVFALHSDEFSLALVLVIKERIPAIPEFGLAIWWIGLVSKLSVILVAILDSARATDSAISSKDAV